MRPSDSARRWWLAFWGGIIALGIGVWIAGRTGQRPASKSSVAATRTASRHTAPAARERPPRSAAEQSGSSAVVVVSAAERQQLQAAIARSRTESKSKHTERSATTSPVPAAEERAQPSVRQQIRDQIRQVRPLLAECYSLEQAREPDLEGELQLQFTIDGEPKIGGIVTDNEIIGGSLSDRAELTTCIRETLFTLKFPAPEEGGSIVVQYPLAFAPSE